MPCYSPITCWVSKEVNPSGKRSMVFTPSRALEPDNPQEVSCGQCIGCKFAKSREWAIRSVHEAQCWEDNSFITLTFDDEHLFQRERPWSIDVSDFQKFMKRLRKRYPKKPIRYLHCGEYGSKNQRPHYHAIIFNHGFDDKELWSINNGNRYYISDELQELWPFGFSTIGDVTFQSAAYTARYALKKITGRPAYTHYMEFNPHTGEYLYNRTPEYATMSKQTRIIENGKKRNLGGLGKPWFDKFQTDVYPGDFVVIDGRKMTPPKYYDKLLERIDGFELDAIKMSRIDKMMDHQEDLTFDRLKQREKVQESKNKRLIRSI